MIKFLPYRMAVKLFDDYFLRYLKNNKIFYFVTGMNFSSTCHYYIDIIPRNNLCNLICLSNASYLFEIFGTLISLLITSICDLKNNLLEYNSRI